MGPLTLVARPDTSYNIINMKHFFPLVMSLCLFAVLPAEAQNISKILKTSAKAALEKTAAVKGVSAKGLIKGAANSSAKQLFAEAASREKNRLDLNRAIERQLITRTPMPPKSPVFRAVSVQEPSAAFSGTLFSVERNGKEEIYGVVATHSISSEPGDPFGLQRRFVAVVYDQGKPVAMQAKIVAASPVSMLDIALVKFPNDKKALLNPYRLANAQQNDKLHSLGFNRDGMVTVNGREVLAQFPASLRTTMPLERHRRPGLCGGAVLNEREELVGIHTGSRQGTPFKPECAYATPSAFLNFLVDAYHQGETGTIPFFIRPHQSINLALNEYVSRMELLDANQNTLAHKNIDFRLSYSKLQEALNNYPQAQFLRIFTQEVSWAEDGSALLVNSDDPTTGKIYLYDLAAGKLLSVSAKH